MEAAHDDPAAGDTAAEQLVCQPDLRTKQSRAEVRSSRHTPTRAPKAPLPRRPPAVNEAVESAYPQNPNLIAAFEGVGIKYFGSDASKPYPNPAIPGSTTPPMRRARRSPTGPPNRSRAIPTNIYYNASTEAQEVDEFNTLYTPVAEGGKCIASPTTTCETKPANFAEIVNDVDTNMFQHVMGNDPRPHYFHQTNLMGSPPPGPATTGTPPATSPSVGNGLFYSVMNPLLEEYNQYFNTPFEQPTMAQIGELLAGSRLGARPAPARSAATSKATRSPSRTPARAVNTPLTGVTGVGASTAGSSPGGRARRQGRAPTPPQRAGRHRLNRCSRNRRGVGWAKLVRRGICWPIGTGLRTCPTCRRV